MLFGQFVPDCVGSNLRGAKFKTFPKGIYPQTPLVGTHAYATIILLPSCFTPPQLKILYETLSTST